MEITTALKPSSKGLPQSHPEGCNCVPASERWDFSSQGGALDRDAAGSKVALDARLSADAYPRPLITAHPLALAGARMRTYVPMTSQGTYYARFRRALSTKNLLIIRAAAAELPRIGLPEAAAILLVTEEVSPERYEATALRWLAKLVLEGEEVGLADVAGAAEALEGLPHEPAARRTLAEI